MYYLFVIGSSRPSYDMTNLKPQLLHTKVRRFVKRCYWYALCRLSHT